MDRSVTEHIEHSDGTLFSFELLPPLKGQDFGSIQKAIDPLIEFNPAFINITYHQQEIEYENLANRFAPKNLTRLVRSCAHGWRHGL